MPVSQEPFTNTKLILKQKGFFSLCLLQRGLGHFILDSQRKFVPPVVQKGQGY